MLGFLHYYSLYRSSFLPHLQVANSHTFCKSYSNVFLLHLQVANSHTFCKSYSNVTCPKHSVWNCISPFLPNYHLTFSVPLGELLSHFQLFVTPCTAVPQAPLCPWGCPRGAWRAACPRQDTGGSCHFLFQGVFPTQGSKLHLLQVFCIAGGFFTVEPPGKSSIPLTLP